MKKLQLLPDSSSYNVKFGDGNISTKLNGGASRVRKDSVDNVHSINVGFNLNKEQYQYIMAFYRHITKRGALPFLMDLITDEGNPQTHKVQIVPNTFQLTEQSGHKYTISFTIEAEPLTEHAESDNQLIANYESGKPLNTDPQQGWGNFFRPTELDENATNVQDGIYRINGDVVISLRDGKGRIYQTRYTRQGIDTRFFDTKWSTWLNIGGKRLLRTFTTAYEHNTGEIVKQFDGAGINGNLPNGEYDITVTEEYADGSQQEVSRTRQVINMTSGTLTTIPSNYAIYLQWSVPAKSGGYTEIWVSNNTNLSNAKLINVVDWPLDSYMYTGASQHQNYYFWVRPIDKRGIEGSFTGPVKGEVATPFEEDFRNLQNQLQESLNQTEAKTDKKLQSLEADVKDIVRKTSGTANSDINKRLDGFDERFKRESQENARKITEATSKVNGLTTTVQNNTLALNGISAEKTVFIDNNGYLTGYKLLSDLQNGQPRGEIYFSVDKFKVGKPGYNNVTPFTIDTANRTIAIDGSLVVNGEALIRKLNAGVIDAAKIKAGSIDSSRIAANAITADKIGAGQVTAQKIASRAITADHMNVNSLSAITANLGNVTAGSLNLGNGRFTVDNNGNVSMSSSNGQVGMKLINQRLTVHDTRGYLRVVVGFKGNS